MMGRLALVVLALVVLVLLLVQTRWGSQVVGEALIALADPFEGATLEAGRIGGNWLTSLELRDVTVTRDDSVRMVHVDTIRVRHRLLDLFWMTYHARSISVAGPEITMTQRADTSWDLLDALLPETAAPDTTPGSFTVQFDQLRLTDGRFAARFYASGRDSVFQIDDLNTNGGGLTIGPAMAFRFDTLWAALTPPGHTEATLLQARTLLDDGRLNLIDFSLDGPGSHVTASGNLRLPDDSLDTFYDVDVALDATPLALRDLFPFFSTPDTPESAEIHARVLGTGDLLTVNAEAEFSDGARLAFNAEASLTTGDTLTYRVLEGTSIRALDPSVFTGDPAMAGRINANLTADLHGPALDSLNGSLNADVFDTRYGEYDFDPTTLRATFTDGNAAVRAQTGLRGANLSINGDIRPLDESPVYDFRGRFDSLDVGQFVEGQNSHLKGTLRLAGRDFDPTLANLTARLDLDASRYNLQRLDDGTLTASLADGTLNFDARLRYNADSLTMNGTAWLGDTLRYEIREVQFDGLDVAALLGDTTHSAFSGSFALRGEGTDPAAMTFDAVRLDLVDSQYGPYNLYTVQANGALRGGVFDLDAEADLEGGVFDLDGTLRPFDTVPAFSFSRVDFRNVDAGKLLQDSTQTSKLNGTLRLAGRGFDPATMTLDDEALLTLNASTYNDQTIDSMWATAALEQGGLTFDASVTTPEGTSTINGSGTPFAERPTYRLNQSALNGLNLGALLDLDNLDTELYGVIDSLTVEGTDPETMTLQTTIQLNPSRINQENITNGKATIELCDGLLGANVNLDLNQGRIRLDTLTGYLFDERPSYAAAGSITNVDLASLGGLDSLQLRLSASFEVEGEGLDPQTMRLTKGVLNARNGRYNDITVRRLESAFTLHDGLLRLDTLVVRSNVAEMEGGGAVALFDSAFATLETPDSLFTLRGTLLDDKPLRPYVEAESFSLGEGMFEATLTSRPGELEVKADAVIENVIYNDVRVLELEADASGILGPERFLMKDTLIVRRDTLTLSEDALIVRTDTLEVTRRTFDLKDGTVDAFLNRFSIPTLAIRQSEFKAGFEKDSLGFSASLTIDNRRDAKLEGYAELGGENRRVIFNTLSMHLDDDQWHLDQKATITYGNKYRVSNFMLVEDDQDIALDGVIDLNGNQSLGLSIYNFRIGSVADLFEFPGLDGTLNGDLFLSGPAAAPLVEGSLNLDVESQGVPVGRLNVGVDYADLRLELDASIAHQDTSTLALSGSLPMDLRLTAGEDPSKEAPIRLDRQLGDPESDVSFRLDANRFNVGWIEPFLDPVAVDEIEGRLTASVDIGGTIDEPLLTGEATFSDGRLGLPLLGLNLTNLAAETELAGDTVLVNHVAVKSGEGAFTGHGTIDLQQLNFGKFDIEASAEDFRVIDTRPYVADASADLKLTGTTEEPKLTGAVRLFNTDIRPTEESTDAVFGPVEFTEADVQMLERHFNIRVTAADTTTFVLYDAMEMDLQVEIGRDVWLRSRKSPQLNILLTGSLDLKKAPYEEQELTGIVNVVPERSYIRQFGRQFDIRTGQVRFTGPATDPFLNFEADFKVPSPNNQTDEITIKMIAQGSLQDKDGLKLELTSEPVPLDQADIISYIATGRPAAEAFQLSGGGTVEIGTDLALNQLTNLIASAAGAELGLDIVEIQQEGSRGATVTAGKYISRRFFASVSWPISFSSGAALTTASGADSNKEVIIEYEFFDWLLLRITSDTSTIGLSLLYQYAY